MKKKSTVRLPPDDDTLNHHLERTNYITYCQVHYDLLEHPFIIGHGLEFRNGNYRPVRHTQLPLPNQLIPVDCTDDSSNESSSDDDSEISDSSVQTSSCLLGTLMINGLEELRDLQKQNLQHGNVQDT